MTDDAYRLEEVTVRFGERLALEIASMEIGRARTTALVGPNGAGKTTLLRLLALLVRPTDGRLWIEGRPLPKSERERLGLRRRVTLVAQSPLLFHRSVRENVGYGLRARGMRGSDRVERALAEVGLDGFAARPAFALSGGEAQRVAIARALALDTPLVLFDEPTANVDREHVTTIEAAIGRLRSGGRTVVFATHDLDQAWRLADSVVALAAGRQTAAARVNVLRGPAVRRGNETYLEAPGMRVELPGGLPTDVSSVAISLAPEEIVVSTEPLHSSARNAFAGVIQRVGQDERGVVLTVDCGQSLIARITAHSYSEMGINIGSTVWLTFKSSAIHVIEPA